MSGFSTIIREESDLETKNQMLEYLSDLMEDLHDFGWQSAKVAHAVLLSKIFFTWGFTSLSTLYRSYHDG